MPNARLLIVPASRPDDPEKLTVIVRGPQSADRLRLLKVLVHICGDGGEWDGPIPNVELIAEREIEADA